MGSFSRRRKTVEVNIGVKSIGSSHPILIQSMVTSPTTNIEDSIKEGLIISDAGGEMVRYTAASVTEAKALKEIKDGIRATGCDIPIVADIHFNPRAAFVAAAIVEKVRINPGNFVDARATFQNIEYTTPEYQAELELLEAKFVELLDICKANNTAIRVGVNHGSLSDRIMSRYGDTTNGMCESAMEFLRVCVKESFTNVVVSMKSSNVMVMVSAYRELVERMADEHIYYPLHLGVTEAGEGEDGRVKSSIGIGTLLNEGIGDTIRVSLTEPTTKEIEVATVLTSYIQSLQATDNKSVIPRIQRRHSISNGYFGGEISPRVIFVSDIITESSGVNADYKELCGKYIYLNNSTLLDNVELLKSDSTYAIIFKTDSDNFSYEASLFFSKLAELQILNPVVLSKDYNECSLLELTVKSSIDFGNALLAGCGDGIFITNSHEEVTPEQIVSLSFSILQSSRARITRTEFISCPGCGRTQFALQEVTRQVKSAASEFKGLKIAVMGCNVNGPGEMADADYGYVGAGKDKIDLYKGQQVVKKGIRQEDAIEQLISLIREEL